MLGKARCQAACHVLTGDVSCQCQFVNIFWEWRHTAFNLSLWSASSVYTHSKRNIFTTQLFISLKLLRFESWYHLVIIKERWSSQVQLISCSKSEVCTAQHMQIIHHVHCSSRRLHTTKFYNNINVCSSVPGLAIRVRRQTIFWFVLHLRSTLCPSHCSWSWMEQQNANVMLWMPKRVSP